MIKHEEENGALPIDVQFVPIIFHNVQNKV